MDIKEVLKPSLIGDLIEIGIAPKKLGRILCRLGGQDIKLKKDEEVLAKAIKKDAERMISFAEEKKENHRKAQARYREKRAEEALAVSAKKTKAEIMRDKSDGGDAPNQPNLPNQPNHTNRSVSVPETSLTRTRAKDAGKPANGNGNGTVDIDALLKKVREFQRALKDDNTQGDGAFFDPHFDAAVICTAITGDYKSHKRWRQLVNAIGQDEIRLELQQFYAELEAGEKVDNPGAALNARLGEIAARGS